ncbi:MAG: ADP-glyceromanno-heptose 6-epimerase [Cocleimonas sp.]|nr:ADP-glyceromanno-heptose 6-epimerase [Cocleimonas sp.]
MIIITGGAGFIGSNIAKALNNRGETNILIVDNLVKGKKMLNINDLDIADYMGKEAFLERIQSDDDFGGKVQAIFHQGACSATTEWNGKFIMENNYDYTKSLLHWCDRHKAQYLYASSASVYGAGSVFKEARQNELPINMYAYSKFQFDQYIRRFKPQVPQQIVGFRYFNVYGPREQHKGTMSSTAFHFHNQINETGVAKLFAGIDGYDNGEQRRDFIYIDDIVDVNLWFLDHPEQSGIFNLGTGRSESFNDMAKAVIKWHGKGKIDYIPFPDHLKGAYQSFTQADITHLRESGYRKAFRTVEDGVRCYLDAMTRDSK